jgi:hypothetical protein
MASPIKPARDEACTRAASFVQQGSREPRLHLCGSMNEIGVRPYRVGGLPLAKPGEPTEDFAESRWEVGGFTIVPPTRNTLGLEGNLPKVGG